MDQINHLNTVDLSPLSDREIVQIFLTGPILYQYGSSKVVRLSDDLLIKDGAPGEASTAQFAATLGIHVPTVRRVIRTTLPHSTNREHWLIVMDYARGTVLDQLWPTLGPIERRKVTKQVASLLQRLQSTPLNSMPPGPVGGTDGEHWDGPFFTAYGAGPFHTVAEMEDWFNHKIEVCIQVGDMPSTTPRFRFDTLVLTHQDVAPRNIIVEEVLGS